MKRASHTKTVRLQQGSVVPAPDQDENNNNNNSTGTGTAASGARREHNEKEFLLPHTNNDEISISCGNNTNVASAAAAAANAASSLFLRATQQGQGQAQQGLRRMSSILRSSSATTTTVTTSAAAATGVNRPTVTMEMGTASPTRSRCSKNHRTSSARANADADGTGTGNDNGCVHGSTSSSLFQPLNSLKLVRHTSCPERHASCPDLRNKRRSGQHWIHPANPSELLLSSSESESESSPGDNSNGDGGVSSSLLHRETINDDEDAEGDDPLLHTLDRLEDEIDTHTTDMLPLSIQLALEQNLFGWQNLTADILSHVLFTGGAAFLAYYFTSWLLLNNAHHPILQWFQWYTRVESESSSTSSAAAAAAADGKLGGANNVVTVDVVPIWDMSRQWFEIIRNCATVLAAIVAFRTVRRRRRVWLHSAYGTSAYERDAIRRQVSLRQADQTTLLGKLRQSWGQSRMSSKARKLAKKVRKAQTRFERKRQIMLRLELRKKQQLKLQQQEQHQQRGLHDPDPKHSEYTSLGSFSVDVGSTSDAHEVRNNEEIIKSVAAATIRKRRRSKRCKQQRGGKDMNTNQNQNAPFPVLATIPPPPMHVLSISPLRSPSACSISNPHPQAVIPKTVLQDQIPISEIEILPYAHGGFFGAAPFMLGDPFWVNILRELMPDVYVEVAKRIFAPTPKLIHWAENNPVVAAYGALHEREAHGRTVTLEWDVFLDPYLVDRVVHAMEQLDAFHAEHYVGENSDNENENDNDSDTEDEQDSSSHMMNDDTKKKQKALEKKLQSAAMLLVEKMLIAHGSSLQLMMEQIGYAKRFNFSRIKRQRRTLGGGMYARQWLAVYAQAVKMAHDNSDVGSEVEVEAADVNTPTSASGSSRGNGRMDMLHEEIDVDEREKKTGNNMNNNKQLPVATKVVTVAPSYASTSSDSDSDLSTASASDSSQSDGAVAAARRRTTTGTTPRAGARAQAQASPLSLIINTRLGYYTPGTNMVESIDIIQTILGAPVSLVLDLKSRHVPKEVWALVVDSLRDCGARVEGVASFTIQEIRGVSECCVLPCQEIVFFHSAGDVQKACHEGLVKEGDSVFFNAGSLLWDLPMIQTLQDVVRFARSCSVDFDVQKVRNYAFRSYARMGQGRGSNNVTDEDFLFFTSEDIENSTDTAAADARTTAVSTIADYKDHYRLNVGLYCQEFAVDDAAIDLLIRFVNSYPDVFNLGMSWGGVNGYTVKGIQPTRFTNTDGFWNQRYCGEAWDYSLKPGDDYYNYQAQ
jgi:hypothetical protein